MKTLRRRPRDEVLDTVVSKRCNIQRSTFLVFFSSVLVNFTLLTRPDGGDKQPRERQVFDAGHVDNLLAGGIFVPVYPQYFYTSKTSPTI